MVVKGIVLLRGCQRLCQFFDILKRTPSHIFSSYHSKSYPISYSSIASIYRQTQTQRRAMTHRQASSTPSLPSIESWQHPSDGDLLEGLKRQKWEDDSRKAFIKWTGRKPTHYKISRKKDWHWNILNWFNTKSKDSSCWILNTSMVERNVVQNICKNEMWHWQNIQTSWHQQPYHYNALLFNSRRRVLGEGKVLEGGGQVGARMCIWEVWKSRRIEGHLLAKAAAEASAWLELCISIFDQLQWEEGRLCCSIIF